MLRHLAFRAGNLAHPGKVWNSVTTLSQDLLCNRKTVMAALTQLESKGLLTKHSRPGCKTVYELHMKDTPASSAETRARTAPLPAVKAKKTRQPPQKQGKRAPGPAARAAQVQQQPQKKSTRGLKEISDIARSSLEAIKRTTGARS